MGTDILVLEENKHGEDVIIGDVHGNRELLERLLGTLSENDRLIIVGDLADRGADSLGVFQIIMKVNAERERQGLPPRIVVSRGNHEDMFLRYYDNPDNQNAKNNLFRNGGEWVQDCTPEELSSIAQYIRGLPYIIHTSGNVPYNVVHADMPFNDIELQKRIRQGNLTLTANEKDYATWARMGGQVLLKDTGRNTESTLTYCGHTIGEGVRARTRHVNLDIGTYSTMTMCAARHKEASCALFWSGNVLEDEIVGNNKTPQSIAMDVTENLQDYREMLEKSYNDAKSIIDARILACNAFAEELKAEIMAKGRPNYTIDQIISESKIPGSWANELCKKDVKFSDKINKYEVVDEIRKVLSASNQTDLSGCLEKIEATNKMMESNKKTLIKFPDNKVKNFLKGFFGVGFAAILGTIIPIVGTYFAGRAAYHSLFQSKKGKEFVSKMEDHPELKVKKTK